MVAPSHRGGSAATDLMSQSRPYGEELGFTIGFGASEPHLVSFYAQFGQRPYAARQFYSEESGYMIPNFSLPLGAERLGPTLPRWCAARPTITSSRWEERRETRSWSWMANSKRRPTRGQALSCSVPAMSSERR